MARIKPPTDNPSKKATKTLVNNYPYSLEYYKKIVEQADQRIREDQLKKAEAIIHASRFVAL